MATAQLTAAKNFLKVVSAPIIAPKSKAPSRQQIEAYLQLAEQRKELERQARELEKQEKLLASSLTEWIEGEGGEVRRCGYTCSLISTGVRPSWKNEFVARCGEQAACDVIANTPPSLKVQISKG